MPLRSPVTGATQTPGAAQRRRDLAASSTAEGTRIQSGFCSTGAEAAGAGRSIRPRTVARASGAVGAGGRPSSIAPPMVSNKAISRAQPSQEAT